MQFADSLYVRSGCLYLSPSHRRAGYLITLSYSPSWNEKFGGEVGRLRRVAQGEFQNLPGAGKPLSLEEYFSTPEDLRIAFSLLKNANCAPVEVELLNEVSNLTHTIAATSDAATKQLLQRTLIHRQTQLALALERRSPRER